MNTGGRGVGEWDDDMTLGHSAAGHILVIEHIGHGKTTLTAALQFLEAVGPVVSSSDAVPITIPPDYFSEPVVACELRERHAREESWRRRGKRKGRRA